MFKLRSQFLDKALAQFKELYLRMGIALKILITIDKEILQLNLMILQHIPNVLLDGKCISVALLR